MGAVLSGTPDPTPATRSFTVDTGPPDTTINGGPSGTVNTTSQSFPFSGTEAGVTFECRLDTPSGNGTFAPPVAVSIGPAPRHAALADMDGDGRLDVVVAGSDAAAAAGWVAVLIGDGTGQVGAASSFAVGSGPGSIVVLDSDADGRLDVAVSDPGTNGIILLDGDGSGGLAAASKQWPSG